MIARRTSREADLARCLMFDDDGDCESLVTEWDRESILGVEMGDSGGDVGESGSSVGSAGVFFGCCGGGIIWAGRCCFCKVVFVGMFLNCFPPISFCDRIPAIPPL